MHCLKKATNFERSGCAQLGIWQRAGQQWRGDVERISRESLEQRWKQRPARNCAHSGGAKWFGDFLLPFADFGECLIDHRPIRIRPGARNQVDQLAPTHRAVVRPAGAYGKDSGKAVVEFHWMRIGLMVGCGRARPGQQSADLTEAGN